MAAIGETLGIMNQIVDFSVKMPRISREFDPHPSMHPATPVREQQDINRSAYSALQNGIEVEKSLKEREDTSVKEYKAGKKSFQEMLRKVTETSAEDSKTVAAYIKKSSSTTTASYTSASSAKTAGTTGKLVDVQS